MKFRINKLRAYVKSGLGRDRRNVKSIPDTPPLVEFLEYGFILETIGLQVPDLGRNMPTSAFSVSQEHLDDHMAWRMYTEPWKDGGEEALIKASMKEVEIVRNAFPLVSSSEAVLAMAAWFAALLIVDDLVENMNVRDARDALADSIKIFCGSGISTSEDYEKPVIRVCHAVRSLWIRIHYLLEPKMAQAMLGDIKACLEGQMAELPYRSTPCASLGEYARIRRHSIGAMPFLTLACLQLSHNTSKKEKRFLAAIKDLVVSVVFLQNDLVGLEKDLGEDATMNALMVMKHSRGAPPIPTSEDLREITMQHNTLVSEALFMYRRILEYGHSEGYKSAALSVVSFIQTHLKWAMKSKRYSVA